MCNPPRDWSPDDICFGGIKHPVKPAAPESAGSIIEFSGNSKCANCLAVQAFHN
jgi:hypothetical protein